MVQFKQLQTCTVYRAMEIECVILLWKLTKNGITAIMFIISQQFHIIYFSLQVGRRYFFKLRKLTLAFQSLTSSVLSKQPKELKVSVCFRSTCKPTVFKSYSDWHPKNLVFSSSSASHIDKTVCNCRQDLISWRLLQGKNLKGADLCPTLILGRIVKLRYYKTRALLMNEILGG